MYSERITQHQIEQAEQQLGFKLERYAIGYVDDYTEHLNKLRGDDGNLLRGLTAEEQGFIRNELVMSKLDFLYWSERYGWFIPNEGGRTARFNMWASQRIVMRHLAELEDRMWDAQARGDTVDGILVVLHKARQLGATQFGQFVLRHRFNFWPNVRFMIASKDEDATKKVFNRGEMIFGSMPYWMKADVKWSVRDEGVVLEKMNSFLTMQNGKQPNGIGMGETYECGHLTECAAWDYPSISIEHNYFPTIPQSVHALQFLESTAQGRGNWWHTFTEKVRKGNTRWRYTFVPWYVEKAKYRRTPPPDWSPNETSLKHAEMVERTSPQFLFGEHVTLSREQLYWYESTYNEYYEGGTLNLFLTNYCATPEESFQHTTSSAFDPDTLNWLRTRTLNGVAYVPANPELAAEA